MSSLLSMVRSGKTNEPIRIVLHGQEGVGKTTWAAGCPNALFLTAEDGGGDLEYNRVFLPSWNDLRRAVRDLADDPGEFRTVVIDTITSYERSCWAAICEENNNARSIEDVGGGYGKGFTAAAEEMAGLTVDLDRLRAKQRMHVIVLAHSHVRPFNDPLGNPFDRYEIRMHAKSAAVWLGWADAALFACFDVTVKTAKRNAQITEKGKAMDGARRVIYTTKEAAYDAKNRYNLPEELPLRWADFARAIGWEKRDAEMRDAGKPKHDPSFDDNERKRFCAVLNEAGIGYEDAAAFAQAAKRPRPSGMTQEARDAFLAFLKTPDGRAKFGAYITNRSAAAK